MPLASSPNPKFERTHCEIRLEELEQPENNNTTSHDIYYCPECDTKFGSPDNTGKLYYSDEKEVGVCFRCNTVFWPINDEDIYGDTNLKRAVNSFLSKKNKEESLSDIKPIKIAFEEIDDSLLNTLKNRNPYLPMLKDILGLKAWYGKYNGIITPFIMGEDIVKFQVRFVNRPASEGPKYYTSPGPKLLYTPFHNFIKNKLYGDKVVTLCEGTYDAIALAILGYPNPVAILGSSVTPLQIIQLRKLMPENCFIVMDKKEISYGIRRSLYKKLKSVSDYAIHDFNGLDPEEHLLEMVKTVGLSKYLDSIKRWKSYTE